MIHPRIALLSIRVHCCLLKVSKKTKYFYLHKSIISAASALMIVKFEVEKIVSGCGVCFLIALTSIRFRHFFTLGYFILNQYFSRLITNTCRLLQQLWIWSLLQHVVLKGKHTFNIFLNLPPSGYVLTMDTVPNMCMDSNLPLYCVVLLLCYCTPRWQNKTMLYFKKIFILHWF